MKLEFNEIKKLIPHRRPFLFVDNCEILERGKKGISTKIFNDNEYFFEGHFPKNPIVPGVIIIESMAQTAGIVVSESLTEYDEKSVLFMSIQKAKFRKPVFPNNKITFEVNFINKVKNVFKFYGKASVENMKVSEAEFSAMISYKNI